jgi:hypothetical protein
MTSTLDIKFGVLYIAVMFCQDSRKYQIEMAVWMAGYCVLLFGSIYLLKGHSTMWRPLYVIVALLPVLPLFGVLNLSMRKFRESDELQKKITAEGIMFGFGVTAILTLSLGFLQANDAAPQDISYVWVWPLLGFGWLIGQVLAKARYR